MRVKQDAIPGMVIPIYFTPTMVTPPEAQFPGCAANHTCWEIACAQLCGLTHYRMQGYLTVESEADFAKWLDETALWEMLSPAAVEAAIGGLSVRFASYDDLVTLKRRAGRSRRFES